MIEATAQPALDQMVQTLQESKRAWAHTSAEERIALLDEVRAGLARVSERIVTASVEAKHLTTHVHGQGLEWFLVALMQRYSRLLQSSLRDLAQGRNPRIRGKVQTRADGQVVARVFPTDIYDSLLCTFCTGEVWMQPGVTVEALAATQAIHYDEPGEGKVVLAMGAGNYNNLSYGDVLFKLFVENQVVVFKANPVNDYLWPLLEEAMAPLIQRGVLRVVYGGKEVSAYLAEHEGVDELHLMGSHHTYNAIVFGPGEEGEQRRARGERLLTKPFTAELGCVNPVIVVPGPWSEADLRYQGENLFWPMETNAGFTCVAPRVVITHRDWQRRPALLDALRQQMKQVPTRFAFYPGSDRQHADFVAAHPEAEKYGSSEEGCLPWTLIPDLDPEREDEICFDREPYCSLMSEAPIAARSVPEFLERAVAFANERLWGTLSCMLVVHPRSMKDPLVRVAVERAVADLRYGLIGINRFQIWANYYSTTTWGAFPGHPPGDIQSGSGVVNNALMFSQAQKSVLRAPFIERPQQPGFPSHRSLLPLAKSFTRFEQAPSPFAIPSLMFHALRG